MYLCIFFFKQKTAYEMRISDWSSDVCSSDLDDAKTEADFGLKVAINAISDEKLRSVERSNIGAAIRDFAQAAGQRDLRAFGFDEALDLIRKGPIYEFDLGTMTP